MTRPKWIAALLLALLVAAGFAWLGKWQLSHAITPENENAVHSEMVRTLDDATAPGETVNDGVAGTLLSGSGTFVAGDFDVVERRTNGGEEGAWVVGHLVTDGADGTDGTDGSEGGHLAVAVGWAPDAASAETALHRFEADWTTQKIDFEGRYMPTDAAELPAVGDDPERLLSMVPAQLVNLWQPFDGQAYAGYLVLHPGDQLDQATLSAYGLDVIDSVAPLPAETINWLNLFYAAEWVVFAGFAVFFWYRLARDDWEKLHELQALAATQSVAPAGERS